jgi:TRAP-type C4-dicarboxylate transport system permease small subunit
MLDRLLVTAGKLSQVVVWFGGGLLIFAAFMTTAEVILRKFFNWSFGGADEIAGYIFAISTSFAYAFATLHRAHVRIDALYVRLPRVFRMILDVLGFVLLGGFLLLMTERAFSVWWNSFEHSSVSITPLVTPLALPQGLWFAGMIFFMLVFLLMLARIISAMFTRNWDRIAVMVGPRGVEEEVEEERANARAELARQQALSKSKEGDQSC